MQRHLRRIKATESLWEACERQAALHGLPDRTVGPMCDAARGWRLQRSLYVKVVKWAASDDISATMATRDLAALVTAGLLAPVGERRGRAYVPSPALTAVWDEVRSEARATGPPETLYDRRGSDTGSP